MPRTQTQLHAVVLALATGNLGLGLWLESATALATTGLLISIVGLLRVVGHCGYQLPLRRSLGGVLGTALLLYLTVFFVTRELAAAVVVGLVVVLTVTTYRALTQHPAEL